MGRTNRDIIEHMDAHYWLTVSAMAKHMRCHRSTVYYWIKRGHCVHTKRWGLYWIAREVEKATTRGLWRDEQPKRAGGAK